MDYLFSVLASALKLIQSVDIAAVVLLILLGIGYYVLRQAQKADGFDLSNMLRDDTKKESMAALCGFSCFAVSSWEVIYDTVAQKTVDNELFIYYGLLWGGLKIGEKIIDKWDGKMPFAKGAAQ